MEESIIGTILKDWGPSGAAVIIVVLFLRSIKERDKIWQDFFTLLNATNTKDMQTLTNAMNSLTSSVQQIAKQLSDLANEAKEHDTKAAEHDRAEEARIKAAADLITQQRKPRATKGGA